MDAFKVDVWNEAKQNNWCTIWSFSGLPMLILEVSFDRSDKFRYDPPDSNPYNPRIYIACHLLAELQSRAEECWDILLEDYGLRAQLRKHIHCSIDCILRGVYVWQPEYNTSRTRRQQYGLTSVMPKSPTTARRWRGDIIIVKFILACNEYNFR